MAFIEVEGLTKRFGEATVVDDLRFGVPAGRITGFLGPNGAGKSTTLHMLLGLVRPSAGAARIAGCSYRDLDRPLRSIGAVLEGSRFDPRRSGRDHLRVLAAAADLRSARVDNVLDIVELGPRATAPVRSYSLGMRRRLALAAALLGEPRALVLDELANGLDPVGVSWLRRVLRELADAGAAVLLSSHILAEVAESVDDVIVIHRGRLVAHAPVAALAPSATAVGTPEAGRLAAALVARGAVVEPGPAGLLVRGVPTDLVGAVAVEHDIALHGLAEVPGSLEDVYMELTMGGAAAR